MDACQVKMLFTIFFYVFIVGCRENKDSTKNQQEAKKMHEMISPNSLQLEYLGLDTFVSYNHGEDAIISNGTFRLKNLEPHELEIQFTQVEFISEQKPRVIAPFKVYVLPDYEEARDRNIKLSPGEEIKLEVSFGFIRISPKLGVRYKIRLEVLCMARTFSAESSVTIIRENPLHR